MYIPGELSAMTWPTTSGIYETSEDAHRESYFASTTENNLSNLEPVSLSLSKISAHDNGQLNIPVRRKQIKNLP